MKVIVASLPDPKFYHPIAPSESWYQWEDKASSKVRLKSKMPDPWRSKEVAVMPHFAQNKGDKGSYPARLDLKVLPIENDSGISRARFVRKWCKGKLVHTIEPVLFFSALSIEDSTDLIPFWLAYSFVADTPNPSSIAQPQSAPGQVWTLNKNKSDGRLESIVGAFSAPEKAIQCKAIERLVGTAFWQRKSEYLWLCQPENAKFYFTIESFPLDRLA